MFATRCYLDFNASAPLRLEAREACVAALDLVGNASSIHGDGRAARQVIESARGAVGQLLRRPADRVSFTSGGTETAATVLTPALKGGTTAGARRLLVSATEHACVLQGHGFPSEDVTVLPVGADGVIDFDALDAALALDGGPAVLAVQAANNETGVIQPVRDLAARVHAAGGLLVCDAVQAAGRLDMAKICGSADVIFLSGHKLGAPKGVGAMALAAGVTLDRPLIRGGGQERGLRSGTENVPGIAGFGAAAKAAASEDAVALLRLREKLEAELQRLSDAVMIFGAAAPRLPNTTCFAVPGVSAETALMALDLDGVAVSSGSACSSGKVARSHVLDAMGVPPDLAAGAIRVSWGGTSTEAEIDRFLEAYAAVMRRMHRRSLKAAA